LTLSRLLFAVSPSPRAAHDKLFVEKIWNFVVCLWHTETNVSRRGIDLSDNFSKTKCSYNSKFFVQLLKGGSSEELG
jgi:hypothetical protein